MTSLCIIPARGGSKRIPRKNIRPFCGRPIIAYSIAAARASGQFDEVMVSTDDDEIAAIAEAAGAAVPFRRSAAASDDRAGIVDVLAEVLESYAAGGTAFETLCCILPTAPFVTAARLAECWQLFRDSGAEAAFPVVRFSYPPQRALLRAVDGATRMADPAQYYARSQDLEPLYHDAGQFYWMTADLVYARRPTFLAHCVTLEIPEMEVQDIDTEADWTAAEFKYRYIEGGAT
ncbi:pseudaminic acid cytidylyltransferase [Zavarzinia sp.]|uniref:pseudaminic acid cytidylyltransferase n=1 Tax=Zavarzinia sp. TaxID=2027920 RepID=UPI003567BBCA